MTQPTVSVIVLGYNGRDYLDACLSSLLDQELPRSEYELLYVDNASSDGSPSFVRERFPDVRVVELERNFGFAEGNNRGVKETSGRYIAVLNQDTVCHRRWLSALTGALEARPDALAAHSNVLTPWCPGYDARDREGEPSIVHVAELNCYGFVTYEQRPYSHEPIETVFLAGAATLVRREAVDRFGYLFDPDFFAYCEDTDLALRLRNLGAPNLQVPNAVVYHDLTPSTSISWWTLRKTLLILRNRGLAFYKNLGALELLGFLPWLVAGAPLKPGELALGRLRSVAYGLALLPLVPVAFLWALLLIPSVAGRRADVLRQRVLPRGALLRMLRDGAAAAKQERAGAP
ncbi:MAG: glycosyltransferase family 2 protein [Dehalococcoidia bacterium]